MYALTREVANGCRPPLTVYLSSSTPCAMCHAPHAVHHALYEYAMFVSMITVLRARTSISTSYSRFSQSLAQKSIANARESLSRIPEATASLWGGEELAANLQ